MANPKTQQKVAKVATTVVAIDQDRLGYGRLASKEGNFDFICTVKQAAGPGGQYGFTSKSWNSSKRLSVKFINKAGDVTYIPCSTAITNMLRKEEMTIPQLGGMSVGEAPDKLDKDGNPQLWITMVEGSSTSTMFNADEITDEELVLSDDFLPEGLLNF